MTAKLKVLNVGGNNKNIAIPSWYGSFEHLLLDIDPKGKPDIVCDARELGKLEAAQFDAIYCSHNLEHYFPHDVPRVLAGFLHVLKPSGFAEIRVPDIDLLLKTYVEKNMDIEDVLYQSPAGAIMVRDVIYGYSKEIERSGVDFYAHKMGFSPKSLSRHLAAAGFKAVVRPQGRPYELFMIGFREPPSAFHRQLFGINMAETAASPH